MTSPTSPQCSTPRPNRTPTSLRLPTVSHSFPIVRLDTREGCTTVDLVRRLDQLAQAAEPPALIVLDRATALTPSVRSGRPLPPAHGSCLRQLLQGIAGFACPVLAAERAAGRDYPEAEITTPTTAVSLLWPDVEVLTDALWWLHRPEIFVRSTPTLGSGQLHVLWQRHGPTGYIRLGYQHHRARWTTLRLEEPADRPRGDPMTSSVLQAQVDDPAVPRLVRGYFERTESGPRFTGAHFETLGGAGDAPDVADRFTAADLVAVTTLSVDVPARAAIILLDERATAYAALLADIPTGVEPDTDQGRRLLTDRDSPLWQLWRELRALDGIGWVTAGKLCARKRPTIAPVYDQHVEAAVGKPPSWWDMVADEFRDPALGRMLEHLADDADVPGHVSRLRLLDIAIWMRQYGHRWLPATEGDASSCGSRDRPGAPTSRPTAAHRRTSTDGRVRGHVSGSSHAALPPSQAGPYRHPGGAAKGTPV